MAKSTSKKTNKEASNTFHNIMAASVKGNPSTNKNLDDNWQPIYNDYSKVTAQTPSAHDYIELKNIHTHVEFLAYFLPFDGVHFMVRFPENAIATLIDHNYKWRHFKES